MSSIAVAVVSFVGYLLAYKFYGGFLRGKIFRIQPDRPTPAHVHSDGVDYVPTRKEILFGHHFASISGTGPIVGPVLGVIWGWVPALLWVFFGSIFMGAVQDFGSIIVSARHGGDSIGTVTRKIISPTTRLLFLCIIFFLLLLVIAVFAWIIGILFTMYPASVLPIWMEIPIAVLLGLLIIRRKKAILLPSLIAVSLMYLTVYIGTIMPLTVPENVATFFGTAGVAWVLILMVYAFIASVLPVETLLQPRDFINAHQLWVAMLLLFLGLIIAHKPIVAPAFVPEVLYSEGKDITVHFLPLLFITIACGAISGFHSLVGSGTTIKQLNNEQDAQAVGYGGMLLEAGLATLVILCVVAGLGEQGWRDTYTSFTAVGLSQKLGAFVQGGGNFVNALGIPHQMAATILAVLIVSFAGTTLDSATRIQRYIITEISRDAGLSLLTRRLPATFLAVGTALLLALLKPGGKGALILWPLFGTTNQLLAGLALLVVTVYLAHRRAPTLFTAIPAIFMILVTGWAMVKNIITFSHTHDYVCLTIGILVLLLEIWMIAEAILILRRLWSPQFSRLEEKHD